MSTSSLPSNPHLDQLWSGGPEHTERICQQGEQDAHAHNRGEDPLQNTYIQEEADYKTNHTEVHSPEEHIVSPGPERASLLGHLLNQAKECIGHNTNEHRMIQGEEEPGRNRYEAGIYTGQSSNDQIGEDSHIHDDEDGAERKEALARVCHPAHPQDCWSKAHNEDENTYQLEQHIYPQQWHNVEQGGNSQHQARDEGEGNLHYTCSGQPAGIWHEAPLTDCHPYEEQIAYHLRGRMCGEGARWKNLLTDSEFDLQEDTNHAPNNERKQCTEYSESSHGGANLEAPRYNPTEEADHDKENWKAEDRTSIEIATEEGQNIQWDGDSGKDAHHTYSAVFLRGRFPFSKEPEADSEDTERYPAECTSMHMREQDILAQLAHKVQSIHYADANGDDKDEHGCLEE